MAIPLKKEKLRELYDLQAKTRGAIRWTDEGFKDQHLLFTQTIIGYLNTARLKKIESLIRYAFCHNSLKGDSRVVLDLGCAEGFHTNKLSKMGLSYVVGSDISRVRLKRGNAKKNIRTTYLLCDAEHLPFQDEAFDFVLCSEVLEHLPQPVSCLYEVSRILDQDGQLILTTPSSKSYVEKRSVHLPLLSISCDLETIMGRFLRFLLRKHKNRTVDKKIQIFEAYIEHVNLMDYKNFKAILKTCNLEIEMHQWSGFYVPFIPMTILLNISPKSISFLEKFFASAKPEPFLWTMLVYARKRS